VVLLPTPNTLRGSMEFGDTMRVAADSYTMTRAFLADLALRGRRRLRPGLYARPDDHGLSDDLQALLREVHA
jgi:hypothetical protein